jgi:hypothetical protein
VEFLVWLMLRGTYFSSYVYFTSSLFWTLGAFGVVVSGHSDLEGSLLATSLATASAWSLSTSTYSSSN